MPAMSVMAVIRSAAIAIIAVNRDVDAYTLGAGVNGAIIMVIAVHGFEAAIAMRASIGCAQVAIITDNRSVDAHPLGA